MKIINNQTRFYTGVMQEQNTKQAKQLGQKGTSRLLAGNALASNPLETQITAKREEAMQKARKLLGDVFAAEKTIDDDLVERAGRIKESEQAIVDANKELASLREEQEKLKEQYGLTGEEAEEELPEEYKMQRLELNRYGEPYRQTITEASKVIREESKVIAAVKVERLKSSPMVAASKEAEGILEAAEEEIVDLYVDTAKETVEEFMEENREKQEQIEEQEELEEAKRKEQEERTELPEVPMKELLELDQVKTEMKQEVDMMLTEMKLLAEDIKGSMVDTEL